MKRFIALFLLLVVAQPGSAGEAAERVLDGGPFGKLTIYSPDDPKSVALFVSGDGGWNHGVIDMARSLSQAHALVVGIDIQRYFQSLRSRAENCVSPAVDLERVSQEVQKQMHLPTYLQPTLVGYSSGATLVYAALAQAPRGTFSGAMSLGFCPDLQMPALPCRGSGLAFSRGHQGELVFEPRTRLDPPWIVLQGDQDQVCNPQKTAAFAARVPGARLVALPRVGHGFSVEPHWLPQFRSAYADLAGAAMQADAPVSASDDIRDLPLSEVPAAKAGDTMALLITGDGGWAGLDRDVSAALARQGMPVVGLSSLKYFWSARTPDGSARDVAQVLRHYLRLWNRSRIVLIGYSFGADVMPFIVNRLPEDLRARVISVNLLGLSNTVRFEVSIRQLLHASTSTSMPVAPEIARLRGVPVLCVYGEGESESLCPALPPETVSAVRIGSGHHFGNDYGALARQIAAFAARSGS